MPIKSGPESSYCLESALECCDITIDVYNGLSLMNYDLDKQLDKSYEYISKKQNFDITKQMAIDFTEWYNNIANDFEKSFIGYSFIYNSSFQLDEISKGLSNNFINTYKQIKNIKNDSFMLLDFNENINLNTFQLVNNKTDKKSLILHQNIFNAIQKDEHINTYLTQFFYKFDILTSNIKYSLEDTIKWYNSYKDELDRNYQLMILNQYLNNAKENHDEKSIIEIQNEIQKHKELKKTSTKKEKLIKKYSKKQVEQAKQAIKKGVNFFGSLFDKKDIQTFLKGDSFEVKGSLFDYKISQSNYDIIEHTINPKTTHIPYSLEIISKDNGLLLADACVYFENTPIIDQIVAFMMYVKTNQEEELLKIANLMSKTDEYYKNKNMIMLKDIKDEKNRKYFNKKEKTKQELYIDELRVYLRLNIKEKLFYKTSIPKKYRKKILDPATSFDRLLDFNMNGMNLSNISGFYDFHLKYKPKKLELTYQSITERIQNRNK